MRLASSPRAALWLTLALSACASAEHRPSDVAVEERIRRVETGLLTYHRVRGENAALTIEERLDFYRVPAVSVAVIDGGRIDWARAWGEREAGAPADTTTLFQSASISKPVAAAGALRLVEDGVLALDGDVNRWLETWQVPESAFTAAADVTLRGLLSHSAGTTVSGFPGYARGEAVPSLVQVLDGTPPANTAPVVVDTVPGALFRYSGGGYSIVQLLIEDMAGQPFTDFMRDRVLTPAGMTRSTFAQPLPAELADAAATAHGVDGAPLAGGYHTYPERAAAGLWSTPSDLSRFVIEIQRAYAGEADRILAPETARRMLTPEAGSYGLGWWVDGVADSLWFYHGGSNEGYQSFLMGSAEGGRGFAVMTNGDGGYELAIEIARSIGQEYGWDLFLPTERDAVDLPVDSVAAFAGTYRREPVGEGDPFVIEIRLVEGELRASLPAFGLHGRRLRAESHTAFFFLENPGEVEFERDAAGAVVALVLGGLGDPLRAVRTEGPAESP